MFDRIATKKGALKGLREYARGKLGEELKGLKGAEGEEAPVEGAEVELEAELPTEGEGEVPLDELSGDSDVEDLKGDEQELDLDSIDPALLEKILAELGE